MRRLICIEGADQQPRSIAAAKGCYGQSDVVMPWQKPHPPVMVCRNIGHPNYEHPAPIWSLNECWIHDCVCRSNMSELISLSDPENPLSAIDLDLNITQPERFTALMETANCGTCLQPKGSCPTDDDTDTMDAAKHAVQLESPGQRQRSLADILVRCPRAC